MDVGRQQQTVAAIPRRWQRIEFLATAEAERAAAMKKKRHVGTELRADGVLVQRFAGERGKGADHRRGIRRAAAQTAAHRDALDDADADIARNARGVERQACRRLGEVRARDSDVGSDFDARAAAGREGDVETVGKRDGVEDRADLVIAVLALAEYGQCEVDLGVGKYADGISGGDAPSVTG